MKVLVTGHDGYIGSVMIPVLRAAGHEVVGADTFFYCDHLPRRRNNGFLELDQDIRDFVSAGFEGFEAVIHLAALSNDPLGELNPELTYEINHKATLRMAKLAKEDGVQRFLYASSCSVYGIDSKKELADENSPLCPLTHYAISKVRVEEGLSELADGDFSPIILRNATAYGWSPNFRSDLVLNNLACYAYTTGEIRILSDGTPWRPVVHVKDIAGAFVTALTAPRDAVHNQAFNVGSNVENYQVGELAEVVREVFPECNVTVNQKGEPDKRSYRVDFSKIKKYLPNFKPDWTARRGVEEMREAFEEIRLTRDDFTSAKYTRLAQLKALIQAGELDKELNWKSRVIQPMAQIH